MLPCKYLYDEAGSELFDQICDLDEYYLTRTELAIMQEHAGSIAQQIDRDVMLVEYGSGSSVKTQILLDALVDPVAYVPVDISEEHLLRTAERLRSQYPKMEVLPVVADFTQPFALPQPASPYSHVALYFPGSTIGNFTQDQASHILRSMSRLLQRGSGLLIGIDLQKDVGAILRAYDDGQGVTARFSLNLLNRINQELEADFDLSRFEHSAVYNDRQHRVEISIVSRRDQVVTIGAEEISFAREEPILTEYSHKYTVDGFARLAEPHGFQMHRYWTDDAQQFALLHLVLGEEMQ
ncbi:L-histidine N(alpha)-methyltransferase [Roseimaritima sediminicola]|uniref:L-histidine N(alpha)-methyltransferase n=1 Tax=Roseimaritima sediminicola TaxID=2662066 RepID=UPI001EED6B9B